MHSGVDGFSRMPVYLKASDNNKASTVLENFRDAVSEFDLPSRVRSDKGGGNVEVSRFMLTQRGTGRGSMITGDNHFVDYKYVNVLQNSFCFKLFLFHFSLGRSVDNQRIERLWRDVFEGCIWLFLDLFYYLENQGLLNPDDEGHIWSLHFVFLPIINKQLQNWRNSYIHHPLRTEHNRTPIQLWISGLQTARGYAGSEDIDHQVQYNTGKLLSGMFYFP